MKFSTTLVATFASLSVAAPAGTNMNHKRQTKDTSIPEVLPGLTGEVEPVEDTTTSSSSMSIVDSATADALAAANPNDIYAVPRPPTTSSFPLEENDLTGIQGVQSTSIQDDHDIVDAAISNLSGASGDAPIPLTTGTPTADDVFSTLDFADDAGDQDDTDIQDLDVNIPPIPLSTGTATTSLDGDGDQVLTVDDVTVDDDEAQAMIDAAVRYAQQFPSGSVPPLSTGIPSASEPDPYLGDANATVFGNSSTSALDMDADIEDGAASAASAASADSAAAGAGAGAAATTTTTVDGTTDLIASLQALNDVLAAYQGLGLTDMDASASSAAPSATTADTDATGTGTGTGTGTAADVSADLTLAARKIKMLGEDMLSGIQGLRKRAEMAEQENNKMKKKMNKVLNNQRGARGLFANKTTTTTTTSKTVMDKMGKGVLERYVDMVGGGNMN
ncbi:hypothetical protein QBC45DRAFT_13748 [Copromyces sp. CBS 386.78]|nr:hypothetical protein QBC45DRAFT_13748 [Copromyces sp. CBS 386.78]